MAKHKPIPQASKSASSGKEAGLKQKGLAAFQRNDFTDAIKQWSRMDLKAEPVAGRALAEAHFRRALGLTDSAQRLADLAQAAALLPGEGRFWYHLALTHHRAGRLDEAIGAYARAAENGFARRPLIFARALAEVERNPRLDAASLNTLTAGDTAALLPIAALLRGDAKAVLTPAAANWFERLKGQMRGDVMTVLWRGLAFLATGQPAEAARELGTRTAATLPGDAEHVRAFYHGLALAASGDATGALAAWSALPERRGSPRLAAAVAGANLGQVRQALAAGRWADVLKVTGDVFQLTGPAAGQPELLAAALIAHNRQASEAAGRNAWAEALSHWQQMADLLELLPALGPRDPILHNLAIAYEKLEQWGSAAEMWVLLMSTLPRRQPKTKAKAKKAADAPADPVAGLSVAEKRAWLRRRALESYRKAGQLEQAIAQYRAAIKAAPDDLDLRLELANALLANDQEVAGRNELRRILERDPSHQEARVRLAELHQMRGEIWEAERLLQEVLDADPDHEQARRGLVEMLRQRGHGEFQAGYRELARDAYATALKLAPNDVDLLVSFGYTELVLGKIMIARTYFDQALAQGTPEAYTAVFDRWAWEDNVDEARLVIDRAAAAPVAMPHFYVSAAGTSFSQAMPPLFDPFLLNPKQKKAAPAPVNPWETLGQELLAQAQATAGDRLDVYQHIVGEVGIRRPELTLSVAVKMTALAPDDPSAWTALALMQGLCDRKREAKISLNRADQLARKRGDAALVAQIADMRRALDDPFFAAMSKMLPMLGDDFEDFI